MLFHVLRPLQLHAGLLARRLPVARLAHLNAVQGDAGVSSREAGGAFVISLVVDELPMSPEVVGARKGLGAVGAAVGERPRVYPERVPEEVVGAREGLGALGAAVGARDGMLTGLMSR